MAHRDIHVLINYDECGNGKRQKKTPEYILLRSFCEAPSQSGSAQAHKDYFTQFRSE